MIIEILSLFLRIPGVRRSRADAGQHAAGIVRCLDDASSRLEAAQPYDPALKSATPSD